MVKSLTVIAPVFEEEQVIAAFYLQTRAVLEPLAARYTARFLFVVDRGRDRTLDVLKALAAQDPTVGIVALSSRFGHQASLLAGIDHCDSDVAVMLDSDLQHPPALIPRLLEEHEKGYDVVFTVREDAPDVGFVRRTSSRLFYRALNRISDVPINENAADFRLVTRRVLDVFRLQIRERNPFLRGLFGWVGFPSASVSFRAERRVGGRTKYSIGRMVRFGVDGVVSFSRGPLHAAVVVGVGLAAIGLGLGVVLLLRYAYAGSFPPGWIAVVIAMSIFGGIQLVFLGILGEYVGAIFDEVKARPHYIVDERVNMPGTPPLGPA